MTTVTVTESRPSTRWTAPLVGGFLSLAIAFGICAGLVAWGHPTFPDSNDGARQRFRQVFPVVEGAGAAVLGFQRVPVTLDRRESPDGLGSRSPERITYGIVVSPLGGLLLIGLALVVGGAVMHRVYGREHSAIASGAPLAAVFAVACFGLSFLLPLGKPLSEKGPYSVLAYTVTYRPSHLGALLWPLAWGLVFGSLGAFVGKHGRRWRPELMSAIAAKTSVGAIAVRAASAGLATGIALVLLAGVLTAVVGVASHPTQAGAVFGSARNVVGIAEGLVLGLPHATGAGLVGSMGIPARYEVTDHPGGGKEYATAGILGGERQRRRVRGGFGDSGPEFERYDLYVPRYALGGLLIAITFTIVTGYRAAADSGNDIRRAVRSAVAAAACLTIVLWIVAFLVGGGFNVTVLARSISGGRGTIGPSRLAALVMPPLWAIGGGLVGALLGSRRRRPGRVATTST